MSQRSKPAMVHAPEIKPSPKNVERAISIHNAVCRDNTSEWRVVDHAGWVVRLALELDRLLGIGHPYRESGE